MSDKKRFAVGARVRVKMPGVSGVVTEVDDAPTVLWEYWHTIQTEHGERREPGCNLELVPRPITNSEAGATKFSSSLRNDASKHSPANVTSREGGLGLDSTVAPSSTEAVAASDDRKFSRLAIEEARKSVPEADGRPHPKVGAVVVKNGHILATAHRGEVAGNHAEFIALEKRLPDAAVAGATVYTTLEPCTTRNHPKIPCADRLVERKVARVVIGMLDPDPRITGRGQRKLRSSNVITDLFPHDLMAEVEDLNREFIRLCDRQTQTEHPDGQGVAEQLKQFAAEKKTVLIRPLIPPQPRNPDFQIDTFNPNQIVARKLSSSHLVSIPLSRVSEILWGFPNEVPTLILDGRLQWVTIPMQWKFFPELPPSTAEEYLGLPKTVGGLQDPHVKEIERELSRAPYEPHWFRRENLPTSTGAWPPHGWQPFYDEDGRYLVCGGAREALIFSVRIRQ